MKFVSQLIVFLYFSYIGQTLSQSLEKKDEDAPRDELRLGLNNSGTHYVKLTFLNQVWIRI